ncbi:MAG: hypothetical protein AAF206_16145 [Bacteroidota bacterium]
MPNTSRQLRLWLKYRHEFALTKNGTVILTEGFRNTSERERKLNKLYRHASKRREEEKILKARIYEDPGNRLIWEWNLPFKDDNQSEFKHEAHQNHIR